VGSVDNLFAVPLSTQRIVRDGVLAGKLAGRATTAVDGFVCGREIVGGGIEVREDGKMVEITPLVKH
jgi:hypothetical protein